MNKISTKQLLGLLQQRTVVIGISCLLLLFITWQVWTTIRFFQDQQTPPSDIVQITSSYQAPTLLSDLADRHLFGISPSQDAPETQLNLQLSGIYQSSSINSESYALITMDQNTQNYTVGDVIANAVIEEILPNRVVIRHNGRLETLSLSRQYPDLNSRFSG